MKREAVTHCLFSIVALVLGASSFAMEKPRPTSLKKPNDIVVTIDNTTGKKNYVLIGKKNYVLIPKNFPPDYRGGDKVLLEIPAGQIANTEVEWASRVRGPATTGVWEIVDQSNRSRELIGMRLTFGVFGENVELSIAATQIDEIATIPVAKQEDATFTVAIKLNNDDPAQTTIKLSTTIHEKEKLE
jgi:hypothetical protein